jgi:hypothetical protein
MTTPPFTPLHGSFEPLIILTAPVSLERFPKTQQTWLLPMSSPAKISSFAILLPLEAISHQSSDFSKQQKHDFVFDVS